MRRFYRLIILVGVVALTACSASGDGTPSTDSSVSPTSSQTLPSPDTTSTTSVATTVDTTVSGGSCESAERYTEDEVLAGAAPQSVTQVYPVPKCELDVTLGFINADATIPQFVELENGIRDAAAFYGVELVVSDLRGELAETASAFETMLARSPDVVGTRSNLSDTALVERAGREGIPVLLSGASLSDPPADAPALIASNSDAMSGEEVGHVIGEAAAERLQGDWEGRDVTFIAVTEDSVPVIVVRMEAALEAAREHIDIPDDKVVRLQTLGEPEEAQNQVIDTLTARPDDVFVVAPLNDEVGVGALQGFRSAGRTDDGVIALLGGNELARATLRSDESGVVVGAVYTNPYAQGWGWVEAALAVALGEDPPQEAEITLPRVTAENVDELFPND